MQACQNHQASVYMTEARFPYTCILGYNGCVREQKLIDKQKIPSRGQLVCNLFNILLLDSRHFANL